MFLEKLKPLVRLQSGEDDFPLLAESNQSSLAARRLVHQAFAPMVVLIFVLWILYRSLFSFPVWFDETVGKAVFFGLPVWLYISMTGFRRIIDSLSFRKIKLGLWRGIAFGALYGMVVIFIRLWEAGWSFRLAPVFMAPGFWWEFLLALFTAFWETIFFFSFIGLVIKDRWPQSSTAKQVLLTTMIFMLFHVPNIFLNFPLEQVFSILLLLTLFAIGQSLLFTERENAYTLIISHAIWGMILLVYF